MGMWGKKIKKFKASRGREIEKAIANDCWFYCGQALRHGGGSHRRNLFLCKSSFRGSLSNSFTTTSLTSLLL